MFPQGSQLYIESFDSDEHFEAVKLRALEYIKKNGWTKEDVGIYKNKNDNWLMIIAKRFLS